MPDNKKFNDAAWTPGEWRDLLEKLISDGLLTWKEVTTLTLGHMNPSQVGTSLASSDGFKRLYGKGQVMPKVMEWFYQQDGKCHDCGTRLELQADHNKPREEFKDPLDADFIENMVLRCRRCNVIKRPSHEFGGQTHLTAETALMWILFGFRPRTLPDFVRMCRLYGMTMADVRMQEGWAMAHWLQKLEGSQYKLDAGDNLCQILVWPDGGITRCWTGDDVPKKSDAKILFEAASPDQHLVALAYSSLPGEIKVRIQAIRYRVGNLPFSHYFPDDGAEYLAITYTPPKRKKNSATTETNLESNNEDLTEDAEVPEQVSEELNLAGTVQATALSEGAKINLLAPRGMKLIAAKLLAEDADATVTWTQHGKSKALVVASSGRGKKVCDIPLDNVSGAAFQIQL